MNALQRAREKAGLSQNGLAQKANVSQAAISDIEAGRTKAPRIDTLMSIAKVIGCGVEDLLDQEA